MTHFSKANIQKLHSHLQVLQDCKYKYKKNYKESKSKTFCQTKIFLKNKKVAKTLLTEALFINLGLFNLKKRNSSLLKKLILKNKKIFINQKIYSQTFLTNDSPNGVELFLARLNEKFTDKIYRLNLNSKTKINLQISNSKNIIEKFNKTYNYYYFVIKDDIFGKWYIFLSRLCLLTVLHFIPFIQLTTSLLYSQPNKQIVHPITGYLFNFVPFMVPLINFTMPVINQDTFAFLILAPYIYFFIYSFRRYNISRKIAYQGSFALMLMLFRYSLLLSQEAITVIYKFAKRFFFLRKFQNFELLRDDLCFYLDDLEELRSEKEYFLQLSESIFSLRDLTKITKLWESTTIFSLLGVIALLYNYMYFILRGQKPIIPIVTKTVQRMMIDRNSIES